ncbi:hypothetical protein IB024_16275 [Brucella sp. 6810]|nr:MULTISPECIES: hypothetical protein [unclassified Brucella]MRN78280.1 hypothetical protein [Brucella sp. 10RB9210]QNQ63789.1 hypothetical protein IB024_16275 [Brucella sp. 6810]
MLPFRGRQREAAARGLGRLAGKGEAACPSQAASPTLAFNLDHHHD